MEVCLSVHPSIFIFTIERCESDYTSCFEWMDGWMSRQIDGQTDFIFVRVAWLQLSILHSEYLDKLSRALVSIKLAESIYKLHHHQFRFKPLHFGMAPLRPFTAIILPNRQRAPLRTYLPLFITVQALSAVMVAGLCCFRTYLIRSSLIAARLIENWAVLY